jgi:ATP-binding cassette subfamily B protein
MRAIHKTAPSKSLFGFVFFFLKKQWIKLLVMQFLWFAWSLDQTVFPLLFGKIIDGFTNYVGLRAEAWPVLSAPILAAMGLWVGIEISFRLGGILMANVFPKLEKQIRMYMFSHMQDQSQAYFSTHFAGNISTKISDMVDNMNHVLNLIITLFLPMLFGSHHFYSYFLSIEPFFCDGAHWVGFDSYGYWHYVRFPLYLLLHYSLRNTKPIEWSYR